jgi:bifunctional DNA-binding transcriptional regulator/antitoxin component of YhaV-PrlF toxin-antitoxin module
VNTISVRVEKSGRVLIPVAVRRQLGLKEGKSDLLLHIDQGSVGVTTRDRAVAEVQKWAARYAKPGRPISDDLIKDRRREAARESGG